MRHRYECPIRWADLDLLGHVNNARYVDYLQEARIDMLRAHRWAGGTGAGGTDGTDLLVDAMVVSRQEVTYRAPLLFSERPVSIECWVTQIRTASFTIAYEVFHEDRAGERTVYVEATTLLAPYRFDVERPRRLTDVERSALARHLDPAPRERPPRIRVARPAPGHYPVHTRFSDVDVYRHVNNVVYFEYFQEARIQMFTRLGEKRPESEPQQFVVARMDVDYLAPILLRPQPYDCWSQIGHVGRTSVVVDSEIADGDRALARARVVLVFFDGATQRPVEPAPATRELLLAAAPQR